MSLQVLKYEAIFPLFYPTSVGKIPYFKGDAPKYELPQLGSVGGMTPKMNKLVSGQWQRNIIYNINSLLPSPQNCSMESSTFWAQMNFKI
jgi:hypothetical protein